ITDAILFSNVCIFLIKFFHGIYKVLMNRSDLLPADQGSIALLFKKPLDCDGLRNPHDIIRLIQGNIYFELPHRIAKNTVYILVVFDRRTREIKNYKGNLHSLQNM